jgi:hypothetical protein
MQDATVWSTQLEWNGRGTGAARAVLMGAADGMVAVTADCAAHAGSAPPMDLGKKRADIFTALRPTKDSAPVLTVAEVFVHPQVAARELFLTLPSTSGDSWTVFATPFKLLSTPGQVRSVIEPLKFDHANICAELVSSIAPVTANITSARSSTNPLETI